MNQDISGQDASAEARTGLYLYGAVPAESSGQPLRTLGIGPDPRISFLPMGRLAIVVGDVPLAEFAPQRVNALLRSGQTQWVEEKALAHAAVLQELMQRGPVVPVRFGILFRDASRLLSLIGDQEPELVSLLQSLSDRVEWGVKVVCPEAAARQVLLQEDRELAASQSRLEGMPEGMAYLYRKRLDMLVEEKLRQVLPQWASEMHKSLAAISDDATTREPVESKPEGKKEITVHQGAYLVRGEQTSRFAAEVERLGARWAARGLQFDLSGPWPPYHFARLRLEASTQ